jgi:hypothetical protein
MGLPEWKKRDLKRKSDAAAKKRDTTTVLNAIEALIKKAIENDAYHPGEVEQLDKARSAVFAVRAGYVRRVR